MLGSSDSLPHLRPVLRPVLSSAQSPPVGCSRLLPAVLPTPSPHRQSTPSPACAGLPCSYVINASYTVSLPRSAQSRSTCLPPLRQPAQAPCLHTSPTRLDCQQVPVAVDLTPAPQSGPLLYSRSSPPTIARPGHLIVLLTACSPKDTKAATYSSWTSLAATSYPRQQQKFAPLQRTCHLLGLLYCCYIDLLLRLDTVCTTSI